MLAIQEFLKFDDHDLAHINFDEEGKCWINTKDIELLEGHNLHGIVEWRHIVRHNSSWGEQKSKKENNNWSLAWSKTLLQGVVCA